MLLSDVKVYVMAVLLDNSALNKINARLSQSGGLQMPYMAFVTKSICVEIGRLSCDLDVALKDEFQSVIIILHKNTGKRNFKDF